MAFETYPRFQIVGSLPALRHGKHTVCMLSVPVVVSAVDVIACYESFKSFLRPASVSPSSLVKMKKVHVFLHELRNAYIIGVILK